MKYKCSECGTEITRHALTGKCRSCSHKGNSLSQAHRDAISKGNLGKVFSEAHRRKLSENAKKRMGIANSMFGRKHTEDARKKMSGARVNPSRRKTKQIYYYLGYDNSIQKEIVWRQKIGGTGCLQGTGSFYFRKIRRNSMDPIQLSSPCNGCQWHHVNEAMVVAVPTNIHQRIKHKCNDGNMIEGIIG